MKIVNSSHEIWQRPGNDESDILRFIEKVGRVCYKSEDKITDDSAEKFVGHLINRNHGAVVEHGALLFKTDLSTYHQVRRDVEYLDDCGFKSFLRFTANIDDGYGIISGNIRAWRDFVAARIEWVGVVPTYTYSVIYYNPRLFPEYAPGISIESVALFQELTPITVADLKTYTEHLVHHDITMKFICDRGVTHEIVRHRPASYAQESTRYCNYTGDKFGNEITVVAPSWCEVDSEVYNEWKASCENAETRYIWMTKQMDCAPQEARSVLPTSTKAELVMTAPIGEWRHFFSLRTAPAAHPDIRALTIPALADVKNDPETEAFFHDI